MQANNFMPEISNNWLTILGKSDFCLVPTLNPKVVTVRGLASMVKRDTDKNLDDSPPDKQSKKDRIIVLYNKGKTPEYISIAVQSDIKHVRRVLILARKIEKKASRGGRKPKPVIQYTLDGKKVAEYASIADAVYETGICQENIRGVCKGDPRRKTAGGFKFSYAI